MMEIWFVWVTVCGMSVEEVLCSLQIWFDKSQWWCYVNRRYVDMCCVSSEGVKWHGGCEVQMFDLWLFARFDGFASWVTTWFRRRVYVVYARALTNIYARCVVIIHGHWLALMQGAWKFFEWLKFEVEILGMFWFQVEILVMIWFQVEILGIVWFQVKIMGTTWFQVILFMVEYDCS